ncbi:unnamed protein product, partial [Ixodes hexagonus]
RPTHPGKSVCHPRPGFNTSAGRLYRDGGDDALGTTRRQPPPLLLLLLLVPPALLGRRFRSSGLNYTAGLLRSLRRHTDAGFAISRDAVRGRGRSKVDARCGAARWGPGTRPSSPFGELVASTR